MNKNYPKVGVGIIIIKTQSKKDYVMLTSVKEAMQKIIWVAAAAI
jgi:hypothetical protein